MDATATTRTSDQLSETYRALLDNAADRATHYLETLDTRSVAPTPEALARLHELGGSAAMRISISSWATTESDVERSLAAILRAAAAATAVRA